MTADDSCFQFPWEAFNLPKHPARSLPNANFSNPQFGRITSLNESMRQMQFAVNCNL
jgi:hypothetical protein